MESHLPTLSELVRQNGGRKYERSLTVELHELQGRLEEHFGCDLTYKSHSDASGNFVGHPSPNIDLIILVVLGKTGRGIHWYVLDINTQTNAKGLPLFHGTTDN